MESLCTLCNSVFNSHGRHIIITCTHVQQAIAALRTKNWRAALAACNACLASNPDNLKARARRADAHKCLGELDEAQADLTHIVGLKVCVSRRTLGHTRVDFFFSSFINC